MKARTLGLILMACAMGATSAHADPYLAFGIGLGQPSEGGSGVSWQALEAGFRYGYLRPRAAVGLQWADYGPARYRRTQSELAYGTLAVGVDLDLSPRLFSARGADWRVLPFVGLGVGVGWHFVEDRTYGSGTGRYVERTVYNLKDASAGGFAVFRAGASIPLLEGRRGRLELVPQVRQTVGRMETTSGELILRWWF